MSVQTKAGRNVLFVGGPFAGDIRNIPLHIEQTKDPDTDFVYRISPVRMAGATDGYFFAFDASQHPIHMFRLMWQEYSQAAQIRRDMKIAERSYQ